MTAPAKDPGQRQIAQALEGQIKVEIPNIVLACISDGADVVRSKGVHTVSFKLITKRLKGWAKERSAPAGFPADARVRACLKELVEEGILFTQTGGRNAQLYSLERPVG